MTELATCGAVAVDAPAADLALWRIALTQPASRLTELESWLSATEKARAARFGRPELAARFVAGRAGMRAVLGHCLGVAGRDVVIERGHRGRPQLAGGAHALRLDFNLSNTRDTAVLAIATRDRVGVDIEHSARTLNVPGVARKFMTENERGQLALLPPDAERRALLRLWTCKEAMSKATGDALSAPMRRIDIDLAAGPRLIGGPAPYLAPHWALYALELDDDYLVTVARWIPPDSARGRGPT